MGTFTAIYIICSICIFVLAVFTAVEDEFIKRRLEKQYKESGIGFIMMDYSVGSIISLSLIILVVSFIPMINLGLLGLTIMYRKGLM